MKKLFGMMFAVCILMTACTQQDDRPVVTRAFLALPDDAFESIASTLVPAAAREALAKDSEYTSGSNEDTRNFSLYVDAEEPDALTVSCFQDPIHDYIQLNAYKPDVKDEWFILYDLGEQIDEMSMKSLLTKGYVFNAKKGTLTEVGLKSDPYVKDDFFEPVVAWPYLDSGADVKSVHTVMMPWGYYVCPNNTDENEESPILNSMPFSLKYVWDGSGFKRTGFGPALGFVDNLAAFNVSEQMRVPYDFEFPGCTMEKTTEQGYNNVPVPHFDLYQNGEHLVRFDPYPTYIDDEGRYVLMQLISYSPRYKTTEGFGVGTPLQEILSSKTLYGMDTTDFEVKEETADDGRAALAVRFQGFEAETLFITDAPEVKADGAKVVEVLIRPIAKG